MSASPEDEEKSKALQEKKQESENEETSSQQQEQASSSSEQTSTSPPEQKPSPPPRPTVGTPIGKPPSTPVGKPVSITSPPSSTPRPTVGTLRPSVGTPVGKPATPSPSTPVAKPATTSTPVGRPAVGSTPVGAPRPSVGGARPSGSAPIPGKPTVPQKPVESKQEVSRRNFLKVMALAGGLIMVGSFGTLFPFLQGSVKSTNVSAQVITDDTGAPVKTSDIPSNGFKIFIWPKSGNAAVDADSFNQCVAIHLPSTLTATPDVSAKDPISGDTFIAFSRVCVHLWCLWNYIQGDRRMECPCHGSQYVPGTGEYPNFPVASNQPPGMAVAGPASLQTAPNNMAPIVKLSIASDGTMSATSLIGQVGCGQKC